MSLLPQDPQSQLKLLGVVLAVAAAALYYNFVYAPAGIELVEMTDRVESLETQNQVAEARIGNLQRLRDDLANAEQALDALQRLVPEGSEVPEIYEAIASETQSLNLELLSIEPLSPTAADSAGTLMRQEWAMIVEGSYHAVGEFLANVASFSRIVRPRVTEVVPAGTSGGGRQLVRATFSLETFVLSPADGAGGAVDGETSEPGESEGARGGLVS